FSKASTGVTVLVFGVGVHPRCRLVRQYRVDHLGPQEVVVTPETQGSGPVDYRELVPRSDVATGTPGGVFAVDWCTARTSPLLRIGPV
ncbi:MAG: hypothetical protein MPN21_23805, partial [Thermoanaerobaculia bacterium]|nr:hypothetical protein [Thermoanaerobaculia bacterium]